MTISEIYSKLCEHMINGLMFHDQMANYYDFLGLKGYKRCHEYHYLEENIAYRKLNTYFINHHNTLIPETSFSNVSVIPKAWYQHTREDADVETKREAVRTGLEKWVNWERETKKLYQEMYQEAMNIGEIASACEIRCLVKAVDKELKTVEQYWLNKEAIQYNLTSIISEQNKKYEEYEYKIEKCMEAYL